VSAITVDRFIVGTGRCGSTLLSLMMAEHTNVVSLHEFFTGLDWGRRFQPGAVDGLDFADVIGAEQPVTTEVVRRGYTSDEICYPFGDERARYRRGDPVPWLLVSMISRLTPDPDPVFDELLEWARERQLATMAEHYRALFSWMAARSGGSAWIERSGSSLDYLEALVGEFPDGRFVHIHRDGHEAALSIRDHRFFRLGVALFMDLFPPDLDRDAQVTHAIETAPPLWAVGRYWSDQVLRGYRALPALDRAQYLAIRFEDLVTRPAEIVGQVATFLDLPVDSRFAERAAGLVRGPPPERFGSLTPDEKDELGRACLPGQVLLGRAEP
jgi:hypothetical protein